MRLSDLNDVYVLRWGHRPRDFRVTTHVALTARAFGARGFILADVEDGHVKRSIDKVASSWGGLFRFEMGVPWSDAIKEWRKGRGYVVHLTMYGQNLDGRLLSDIRARRGDLLILLGCRKVPREFFTIDVSDFNVAIGNQPHSEVAALAVFLDRLFEGEELNREFEEAKLRVIPSERDKCTASIT